MSVNHDDRLQQAEALLRRCLDGFSAYIHGRKLRRSQRDRLREDLQHFLDKQHVHEVQPERLLPRSNTCDWS